MYFPPTLHKELVSKLDQCCSAYPEAFGRPCSHQQHDPYSLCDTCKAANKIRQQKAAQSAE